MSNFAAVFVRRNGASFHGHVGYAFQTNNGRVCYGSIEGFEGKPIAPPSLNQVWNQTAPESVCVKAFIDQGYSECKLLAGAGLESAARSVMNDWSKSGYYLIGLNCAFAVYHILRAYGCYPPTPYADLRPNEWYDKYITSRSQFLQPGKSVFGPRLAASDAGDDLPDVFDPGSPALLME